MQHQAVDIEMQYQAITLLLFWSSLHLFYDKVALSSSDDEN